MIFNSLFLNIADVLSKNKISLILITILFFSACAGGDRISKNKSLDEASTNTLTRIADIPFPQGTKLDLNKSLILGEGKTWSGQLFISIPEKKAGVYNYFVNNLEKFDWKEQTTIRGETSILNFLGNNNRVAIITIREGSFNSSDVLISVTPYAEAFEASVGDFINQEYLEFDLTDHINIYIQNNFFLIILFFIVMY